MLKGTTKIELTNVKTSEKEVIEKHNYITCGIDKLIKPLGTMFTPTWLFDYTNLYHLFGSIHLFNNSIDGDEAETYLPTGDCEWVGGAEYNYTNAAAVSWLGSYNTSESSIDTESKTAKFVFDFSTNQCNGEIGSICLAPQNTAKAGVWGFKEQNDFGDVTWNSSINKLSKQMLYEVKASYPTEKVMVAIKPEKNIIYIVENNKLYSGKVGFYQNTTLFDYESDGIKNFEEIGTISAPSGYNVSTWTSGEYAVNSIWLFARKSDDSDLKMIVVNLENAEITKTVDIVKPSGLSSWKGVYPYYCNGFIYAEKYKIQENNTTIATECDNPLNLTLNYPHFRINDFLFYRNSAPSLYSDYDGTYTNTLGGLKAVRNLKTNKVYGTRQTLYANLSKSYTLNLDCDSYSLLSLGENKFFGNTLRGRYILNSNISKRMTTAYNLPYFLSTINNLDNTVTKTSDKTMKITYTLQEV